MCNMQFMIGARHRGFSKANVKWSPMLGAHCVPDVVGCNSGRMAVREASGWDASAQVVGRPEVLNAVATNELGKVAR